MTKDENNVDVVPTQSNDENVNILAIINNYQNPKELLEFIEGHSPGFMGRQIPAIEEQSKKSQKAREDFARRQAYLALAMRVVFSIPVFYLIYLEVIDDDADFITILALTILFAITQGGSKEFRAIAAALADRIKK